MFAEGQRVRVTKDKFGAGYAGEEGVVYHLASHGYVEVYLPARNRNDENPFVLFEKDELEPLGVN